MKHVKIIKYGINYSKIKRVQWFKTNLGKFMFRRGGGGREVW